MEEKRFFDRVYDECSDKERRIALPEAHDERIVHAANTVASRGIATPVLIVTDDAPSDLHDDVIVDHADPDDNVISVYQDEHDVSRRDAHDALTDPVTYSMGLAATNTVHGVVCGATHPSKTTYREALTTIGAQQDADLVSTSFLLFHNDTKLLFADCALNINPDADDLASIASATVSTAHRFRMSPRVAMLSYSTKGSGDGESPEKVREATRLVKETVNCNVLGEVQFDAAFTPSVQEHKIGRAGEQCNVYIFPDLDAGNTGYKIAEHVGGATAVGPLTQGLRRPVNDLSRGATTQEIIETIALTAHD